MLETYLLAPLTHSQPQRKERNTALFPSGTCKTKQDNAFLSSHTLLSHLPCFTCCLPIKPNRIAQLSLVVLLPLGVFTVSYPPVILIYSGVIHAVTLVEWLVMASHMYTPPAPKVLVNSAHFELPSKLWDYLVLPVAHNTYPEWGCSNRLHKHGAGVSLPCRSDKHSASKTARPYIAVVV